MPVEEGPDASRADGKPAAAPRDQRIFTLFVRLAPCACVDGVAREVAVISQRFRAEIKSLLEESVDFGRTGFGYQPCYATEAPK
jgi:hypothetical protein